MMDSRNVGTELTLADGRLFHSDTLELVFQRIQRLELPQFALSTSDDREYAVAEMHALLLSWFEGLSCPVVNKAGPRGLCGAERSRLEWLKLAASAGLRTRGVELVSDVRRFNCAELRPHVAINDTGPHDPLPIMHPQILGRSPAQFLEPVDGPQCRVLVIGQQCFGIPPDTSADACVKLAQLSGNHLLEIHLGRVHGAWRFCNATPIPEIPHEAAGFVADSLADMRRTA